MPAFIYYDDSFVNLSLVASIVVLREEEYGRVTGIDMIFYGAPAFFDPDGLLPVIEQWSFEDEEELDKVKQQVLKAGFYGLLKNKQ